MGKVHLVTGYAGQEHVTATDHAAFNAALIGTGQFVLDKGNVFAVQVISNNQIRVLDGELMMQGRFVRLNPDTYVDLTIENGAQGMKRNDLIAVRYTKDTASGIESADLVVIKGTAVASTSVPVDPEYTEGDITNGAAVQNDFPLWRIPLDGLNVGAPVMLFEPFIDSMRTLPYIRQQVNQIHSEVDAKIADLDEYTKAEVLTDGTRQKLGVDSGCTPDAVFNKLSEIYIHRWRGYSTTASYTILEPKFYEDWFGHISYRTTVYYSDQIEFDAVNGIITLVNPSSLYYGPNAYEYIDLLRGKYFQYGDDALVYFMEADAADWTKGGSSANGYWCKYERCAISISRAGGFSYLESYDRNAYEDDFTLNGTHYYYRGTVIDNAFLGSKIDYGTFVGTGTYGEDYPSTLTFAFEPKMVFIFDDSGNSGFTWLYGWATGLRRIGTGQGSNHYCDLVWDGNVLTWTANGDNNQFNELGTAYHYVAIG